MSRIAPAAAESEAISRERLANVCKSNKIESGVISVTEAIISITRLSRREKD